MATTTSNGKNYILMDGKVIEDVTTNSNYTYEQYLLDRKASNSGRGYIPRAPTAEEYNRIAKGISSQPDYTYDEYLQDVARRNSALQRPSVPSMSGGSPSYTETATKEGWLKARRDLGLDAPANSMDNVYNAFLQKLSDGGSDYRAVLDEVRNLLPQFSTQRAYQDATGLINQQYQRAQEENMPLITRAIEGAGTSAGSMQALLAQRAQEGAAQAAQAAGAEQARSYGAITSQLASVLGSLAAQGDPVAKMLIDLQNIIQSGKNAEIGANAQITSTGISSSASRANAQTAAEADRYRAELQYQLGQQQILSQNNQRANTDINQLVNGSGGGSRYD